MKPGGYLVMAGVLNQTFWSTGDQLFYSLALHPKLLEDSLKEAGFADVKLETFKVDVLEEIADVKGTFLIRAIKQP